MLSSAYSLDRRQSYIALLFAHGRCFGMWMEWCMFYACVPMPFAKWPMDRWHSEFKQTLSPIERMFFSHWCACTNKLIILGQMTLQKQESLDDSPTYSRIWMSLFHRKHNHLRTLIYKTFRNDALSIESAAMTNHLHADCSCIHRRSAQRPMQMTDGENFLMTCELWTQSNWLECIILCSECLNGDRLNGTAIATTHFILHQFEKIDA